ncbi:sugar phosphate isomerase/epimerase family protein [Siphonobacter aquaeclarae]|uniref:Sugar phosphate isomerase/epimerase n=1 Tax=Siphonobacter aquaeclarae TaxID=563176 RepID=A0A1G9KQQ6_9BACT|nr:sugar phosphate isomerase/epimerase family protein [Siphonobacter aquaeclarae]SDL51989.1 Sugar phosphate isomerase/epimerase [Siphonobacter aquaeclarae]
MSTRREALKNLLVVAGAAVLPIPALALPSGSFTYCLNMSTLRGHKLGFRKELETASKAGFRSVEIWVDTLQEYVKSGNSVADARRLAGDLGITLENAIGFAPWIVPDAAARAKGVEQLKQEMELLHGAGCRRIATPPAGATTGERLDLYEVADRYHHILELGIQTGVIPQLELWGFSKNLSKLGEVLFVAAQSGLPQARILLDVYHLYKGGSGNATLPLAGTAGIEIFHVNDYPGTIPVDKIGDGDRVYPGDGVAPIKDILRTIRKADHPIVLSLEVFNKTYWAQDALAVAKTGLAKLKAVTPA